MFTDLQRQHTDSAGTKSRADFKSTADGSNVHTPHVNVDSLTSLGVGALPCIQPGTTVKQAVGVASAATAAIAATVVRLVSTTDCYVLFGAAPVADNTKMFLPANVPEYFKFTTGEKIAVIRDTLDGNLFITPAA